MCGKGLTKTKNEILFLKKCAFGVFFTFLIKIKVDMGKTSTKYISSVSVGYKNIKIYGKMAILAKYDYDIHQLFDFCNI